MPQLNSDHEKYTTLFDTVIYQTVARLFKIIPLLLFYNIDLILHLKTSSTFCNLFHHLSVVTLPFTGHPEWYHILMLYPTGIVAMYALINKELRIMIIENQLETVPSIQWLCDVYQVAGKYVNKCFLLCNIYTIPHTIGISIVLSLYLFVIAFRL